MRGNSGGQDAGDDKNLSAAEEWWIAAELMRPQTERVENSAAKKLPQRLKAIKLVAICRHKCLLHPSHAEALETAIP